MNGRDGRLRGAAVGGEMTQVPREAISCKDTVDSQVLSRAGTPSTTPERGNQSWGKGTEGISAGR